MRWIRARGIKESYSSPGRRPAIDVGIFVNDSARNILRAAHHEQLARNNLSYRTLISLAVGSCDLSILLQIYHLMEVGVEWIIKEFILLGIECSAARVGFFISSFDFVYS